MKRVIKLETIKKNIPNGFMLPEAFEYFVDEASKTDASIHGYFNIRWTNPTQFELKKEAKKYLLPFLGLGDGGIAAFWFRNSDSVPVVYFDS